MNIPLQAVKAVRVSMPSKVQGMQINASIVTVDELAVFPFLDTAELL